MICGLIHKQLLIPAIATILLMWGCSAPRAEDGGFHSDNPAAKMYAIRQAGERKDPADIPMLVEQLESDDPAVRMFTIEALEQITGTRLGYNPYKTLLDRQHAVQKWVEAVNSGQFKPSNGH